MGLEAKCQARCGDRAGEGTLQLESDALLFRGAFRLKIERAAMRGVEADAAELRVAFDGGPAVFALGDASAKWADRILHPPSLLDKLGVKPGMRISLLGRFDEAFVAELRTRAADVAARGVSGSGAVFLLANAPGDLDRVDEAAALLTSSGGLWIVYPKGKSAVTQDDVFRAGRGAGLTDNKVAAFSATHTALRFVIPVAKRKALDESRSPRV